ncbi:extracellular catalytic domain type 2 short-chain-length polyhydroxyalkanoate depolymerase [Chitinimonas koreensis]|uniref:extracellular catalytic domain type 2 short-chain-length polyhydroxyalkanoate depolymerase n=1 Tax=Chitinimonas koreensis TaxID=356302 RepID=UPI000406DD41|nr:PHB depolymerase family esterase [Chitinimonas koreensis]QNM98081.1 hypothetical protein H9L41_07435 [Chitinimonas koreensis]
MKPLSTLRALALGLAAPVLLAAAPLGRYNVDLSQSSVSGLSAGGFMAVQLEVAHSSVFKGAGIVAGGPYGCAGQYHYTACMYAGSPDVTPLVALTNSRSGGSIDAVANLAAHRVFLFSGTADSTVGQGVMDKLRDYYASFVPAAGVLYRDTLGTAHTFPTDFDSGGNNACGSAVSPYISNCGFDAAGALLQHIYGTLAPRNDGAPGGQLVEFDQAEFVADPAGRGMDTRGWLYVPADCAAGQACRLHVALHGCQQYYGRIGDKFLRNTGYNRWADTNRLIVLYPQATADNASHATAASGSLPNPNGCWDWVGWYGNDFATRQGVQIAAIKAMMDRIADGGGSPGGPAAPTGLAVTAAGTDSVSLAWNAVAGAAGYDVYRDGAKVNAAAVAATAYTDGGLAAATRYVYSVRALAADGTAGPASAAVAATTGGGAATCFRASNYAHTVAGRAHQAGGYAYANGSNQNMGLWNVFVVTTLRQRGPNDYVIGTCP